MGFTDNSLHEIWCAFEAEDDASYVNGRLTVAHVLHALLVLGRKFTQAEVESVCRTIASDQPKLWSPDECFTHSSRTSSKIHHHETEFLDIDFLGFLKVLQRFSPVVDNDASARTNSKTDQVDRSSDARPEIGAAPAKGAKNNKLNRMLGTQTQDWAAPVILRRGLRWLHLPKDYIQSLPNDALIKVWLEYIGDTEAFDLTIQMVSARWNIKSIADFLKLTQAVGMKMLASQSESDGLPVHLLCERVSTTHL